MSKNSRNKKTSLSFSVFIISVPTSGNENEVAGFCGTQLGKLTKVEESRGSRPQLYDFFLLVHQ